MAETIEAALVNISFCFRILQETITKQRQQYFGCIPLSVQEKFVDKLIQAVIDKKMAFKSLCNAQKYENECLLLKDKLQKEFHFLEELKAFKENENTKHFLLWQEEKKILQLEVIL